MAYECRLDWARAKGWLDQDGCLSLIAFDALAHPYLISPQEKPIHDDPEEVQQALTAALERHSPPRTKRAARVILENLKRRRK